MGGAIASLPDGGGNHTPNAEFNFYVDPEAAQIVLRSGIPIVLSPLNVSRKARFTKEWLRQDRRRRHADHAAGEGQSRAGLPAAARPRIA